MVSRKNDRHNERNKKITPYEYGELSFRQGKLTNPYHNKYKFWQHRDWQLGFNRAYFKNLEKVKQNEKINKIRAGG